MLIRIQGAGEGDRRRFGEKEERGGKRRDGAAGGEGGQRRGGAGREGAWTGVIGLDRGVERDR
jgi:hypothetical protein